MQVFFGIPEIVSKYGETRCLITLLQSDGTLRNILFSGTEKTISKSIVFESLIEVSQSPECRARLSHQSELDYFFQRLASPTSTLPAVITLIMILTALVADSSLELPFFSLHIYSTRVLEGGQNPRFIEAFSQFLLVREVRCWISYMWLVIRSCFTHQRRECSC